MDDRQIVDLFWQRDEAAIREVDKKYGKFCYWVAHNILSLNEDAEECVNDTYFQAWNAIPPQRPDKLQAWLGKVVRNRAINLWKHNHTQKRYAGMEMLLSELEECIPAGKTVEQEWESTELTEAVNRWLASLDSEDRILFVRRYWHGMSLKHLAKEHDMTQNGMAKRMFLLRKKLKTVLEREGYII